MMTNTIIGAVLGLLMKPLSCAAAVKLLKARGKAYTESKTESFFLAAVLAVYGGVTAYMVPLSAETVYLFLMAFIAATIAITDIHHRIIPNELVISIIVLTLIFGIPAELGVKGFPEFNVFMSLIGLAACFFIFMLPAFLHKNVGAGDVKLAAAMGFALGLSNSLLAIVLMGSLILASCFLQRSMPAMEYLKKQIPMGPFLSAAMAFVLIFTKAVPK